MESKLVYTGHLEKKANYDSTNLSLNVVTVLRSNGSLSLYSRGFEVIHTEFGEVIDTVFSDLSHYNK